MSERRSVIITFKPKDQRPDRQRINFKSCETSSQNQRARIFLMPQRSRWVLAGRRPKHR